MRELIQHKPASNTCSLGSETGVAPASPPEKTYILSPKQAELVWYVLGLGGLPFTSTFFHRDPVSGHTLKKILWSIIAQSIWLQTQVKKKKRRTFTRTNYSCTSEMCQNLPVSCNFWTQLRLPLCCAPPNTHRD